MIFVNEKQQREKAYKTKDIFSYPKLMRCHTENRLQQFVSLRRGSIRPTHDGR